MTSSLLSSELGILAQTLVPAGVMTWKEVPKDKKVEIMERLRVNFILDEGCDVVERCLNTLLAYRSKDNRCKLHKQWKKICELSNMAEARLNPPGDIEQSFWEEYCIKWEDPKYQAKCLKNAKNQKKRKTKHVTGSRSYVAARHSMINRATTGPEKNRIEFYKVTNYVDDSKGDGGWKTSAAEDKYCAMKAIEFDYSELTTDEIVDKVLETKSGCIIGLGFGPRPMKSSDAKVCRIPKKKNKLRWQSSYKYRRKSKMKWRYNYKIHKENKGN